LQDQSNDMFHQLNNLVWIGSLLLSSDVVLEDRPWSWGSSRTQICILGLGLGLEVQALASALIVLTLDLVLGFWPWLRHFLIDISLYILLILETFALGQATNLIHGAPKLFNSRVNIIYLLYIVGHFRMVISDYVTTNTVDFYMLTWLQATIWHSKFSPLSRITMKICSPDFKFQNLIKFIIFIYFTENWRIYNFNHESTNKNDQLIGAIVMSMACGILALHCESKALKLALNSDLSILALVSSLAFGFWPWL